MWVTHHEWNAMPTAEKWSLPYLRKKIVIWSATDPLNMPARLKINNQGGYKISCRLVKGLTFQKLINTFKFRDLGQHGRSVLITPLLLLVPVAFFCISLLWYFRILKVVDWKPHFHNHLYKTQRSGFKFNICYTNTFILSNVVMKNTEIHDVAVL